MNPLVSVIMPAYNSGATILASIESVFIQEIDLELIIVDDCSSDDTYELIRNKIDHERVFYYRNSVNKGVAFSRNFGVEKARGKYIAFLDSDDIWREDKLRKQIDLIESSNAVICATARELIKHDGFRTGKIIKVPESVDFKGLLSGNVINCSSVLIETGLMKEYPMTDDDIHEDYITWLRILRDKGRAVFLKEPYLLYRLSVGGKSANKFKSARSTYSVYRRLGLSIPAALYYFVRYAVSAVVKYST